MLSGATSCSDDINWLIKINQIKRKKMERSFQVKRKDILKKGFEENQDFKYKNGNKYFIVQP